MAYVRKGKRNGRRIAAPGFRRLRHSKTRQALASFPTIAANLLFVATFPRPRLRSQTTMSMTNAPQSVVACIIGWGSEGVQGGVQLFKAFVST